MKEIIYTLKAGNLVMCATHLDSDIKSIIAEAQNVLLDILEKHIDLLETEEK